VQEIDTDIECKGRRIHFSRWSVPGAPQLGFSAKLALEGVARHLCSFIPFTPLQSPAMREGREGGGGVFEHPSILVKLSIDGSGWVSIVLHANQILTVHLGPPPREKERDRDVFVSREGAGVPVRLEAQEFWLCWSWRMWPAPSSSTGPGGAPRQKGGWLGGSRPSLHQKRSLSSHLRVCERWIVWMGGGGGAST